MALSDCPHCWNTPCSCGYEYWFMDLERLRELARVTRKVLGDRRGRRRPPGTVREEMERRAREAAIPASARNFGQSIVIPASALVERRCGDEKTGGDLCNSCGDSRNWDGCGTVLRIK